MEKVRLYISTARAIAKMQGLSPFVVLCKSLIANVFFGHGIKYFSFYGMATVPLSRFGDYMRKNELERVQRHLNGIQARELADNKLAFHEKCVELGLPSPAVYGKLDHNGATGTEMGVPLIGDASHFMEILKDSQQQSFIFKPEEGFHGHGIRRFQMAEGNILCSKDGVEHSQAAQSFLDELRSDGAVYLLQEVLRPHSALSPLMANGSMGTVRVVTIRTKNGPRVILACVRIPVGDNVNDNFASGETGNLLADVDLETGNLGNVFSPVATNPLLLIHIETHPETGERFEGFQIPHWDEIVGLSLEAADKMESLVTCGWDVALTDAGPRLIETNWRFDVDLMQIASQRPLRAELLAWLESDELVRAH